MLIGKGLVTVSAPVDAFVSVDLMSSDTNKVRVPGAVFISPGRTSSVFNIIISDNTRIDGSETVTVTAAVTNWTSGSAQIVVSDNESTNILLALPAQLNEGSGLIPGGGMVSISGTLTTNLVVGLRSDHTNKLAVPTQIVIPAGQTNANVDVAVLDDANTDGTQIVTVTAAASGFGDAARTIGVLDNDVHHFAFGALPTSEVTGQPFAVTLYAQDINGVTIQSFSGSVTLHAAGAEGAVAVQPSLTTSFTNGIWTGPVTINSESRATVLVADDGNGHTAFSTPFDVVTARLLNLTTSDLVYDPVRKNILAGVPGSAGTNKQSVIAIDPLTGSVSSTVFLGSDPGVMALSDDGRFLYVALMSTGGVARVDLQSQAVDLRFSLGPNSPQLGGVVVEDMGVVPGNPRSLVVSRRQGSANVGVAVYDDGAQRSAVVGPAEFANGYLVSFYNSQMKFYSTFPAGQRRLKLDQAGVTLVEELRGNQYGGDFEFAGGLFYSTSGEVFSPEDYRFVGRFPVSGLVRPDASVGRVIFLVGGTLVFFDSNTFTERGELNVPTVTGFPSSLIRCGNQRVAFRTSANQLFLVQSGLIPGFGQADLAVTQAPSQSTVTVGTHSQFRIAVPRPSRMRCSPTCCRRP